MPTQLAKNWWSLVVRGLLGIMVGVITLLSPGITLGALVLLFGAYALVDGVMGIIGAVKAAEARDRWGVLLLEGLAGIAAAMVTIVWPATTALALVYLIAAWSLATGVFEMIAAVKLRKQIEHEWLLALSGVASIILGVLMVAAPLAGALVIALWFGAYAFVTGMLLVGLGIRLRKWSRQLTGRSPVAAPGY